MNRAGEQIRRMLEACRTASAKSTGAAFGFEQMRLSYLIDTDDPAREAPSARQVVALTSSGHAPAPVLHCRHVTGAPLKHDGVS